MTANAMSDLAEEGKVKNAEDEKVKDNLSEKVKNVADEQMKEIADQSEKVQEMIRRMQEEAMQISELTLMQKDYISEVSTYIKSILILLPHSIQVSLATVGSKSSKAKAFLNKEAHVIITSEDAEATSTPLTEMEPDISMAVLADAMPKIETGLKIKRQRMQEETGRLEQLATSMESIYQTLQEDRSLPLELDKKPKKPVMKAPS